MYMLWMHVYFRNMILHVHMYVCRVNPHGSDKISAIASIHTHTVHTLTINSDGITCHHSTHTYNGHTDIIIIINT